MHKSLFGLIIILLLPGCAAMPPPHDFVPDQIAVTSRQLDASLNFVSVRSKQATVVTTSSGVQITGDAYPGFKDVKRTGIFEAWKYAVIEATNNSQLFSGQGTSLSLIVTLQAMDRTAFGASADTKIVAQYQLSREDSKEIIFDKLISSESTATMSDAIVGGVRGQIALNRTMQSNIKAFIDAVESASRDGKLHLTEYRK